MIRVDLDGVPRRSALRRQRIGSRRALQIDEEIRRIRVPRSFGRIAGVEARTLGTSVIQDDHASSAGAVGLPPRRTPTATAAPWLYQVIQLLCYSRPYPIHQH